MAKFNVSALLASVSGKSNSSMVVANKHGQHIQNIGRAKSYNSQSSLYYKANYCLLISTWNSLLANEVSSWNDHKEKGSTGRNLFIKRNYNILLCNGAILRIFVPAISIDIPNFFEVFVSKFYSSMLLTSLYPTPNNCVIKIKASSQFKDPSSIRNSSFKEIAIISNSAYFPLDLFPYYTARYNSQLKPGYSIIFMISFIDSVSGSESSSITYTSIVNDYFDIIFDSGATLGALRRTQNNFVSIQQLDLQSSATIAYKCDRFNNKQYGYIAYGSGKISFTDDNGLTFRTTVPGSPSLQYNPLNIWPDGICFVYAITPKILYYSADFGRTFKPVSLIPAIAANAYTFRLDSNTFLVCGGGTALGKYIFLVNASGNVIAQSNIPISFLTSGASIIRTKSFVIIGVAHLNHFSIILRSIDNCLNFTSVFSYSGLSGNFNFLNIDNVHLLAFLYTLRHLLISNDAGLTWSDLGSFYSNASISAFILFANGNISCVTSVIAGVFTSQDFGNTWSNKYLDSASTSILNILQLSGTSAICICSPSLKILATYDSGITWSLLNTLPSNGYCDSLFINNNIQ